MPWYGHHEGCTAGLPAFDRFLRDHWLVCGECMAGFVPCCALCGMPAVAALRHGPFLVYPFGKLCPACVDRVRASGPWRERRERALERRVEALQAKFPSLGVQEVARRRTTLDGLVRDRGVNVTLKIAAREYQDERYVFRVELRAEHVDAALAQVELSALPGTRSRTPVSIVRERRRYLRMAFLHLGKLDCVNVVSAMLDLAEKLDR